MLVLGAGVAGLAAIQTAKGLGAAVKAYDVRPAAKEQVDMELGRTQLRAEKPSALSISSCICFVTISILTAPLLGRVRRWSQWGGTSSR